MLDYQQTNPFPRQQRSLRIGIFLQILWTLYGLILLIGLGGLLGFIVGHFNFGWFIGLLLMTVLVVAGMAKRSRRRRQGRFLLTYVEQSTHVGLPLTSFLQSATVDADRETSKQINRLIDAVAAGHPLSQALLWASPSISRRTIDLIDSGERYGNLPEVLEHLVCEESRDDLRGVWRDFGLFRNYVVLLALLFSLVIFVIQLFVAPNFQLIAHDFHATLPFTFELVLHYGDVVSAAIGVAMFFIVIGWIGNSMQVLFAKAVPSRRSFWRAPMDQILWRMPVVGAAAHDLGMSDALSAIATASRLHVPLPQAIDEAAFPHLNAVLRGRLRRWSAAMAGGESVASAARSARMPTLVVGMCGGGARSSELSAVMQFLARHYRSRFNRLAELLNAAAAPVVATCGGAFVLFVWSALYGPIVAIINQAIVQSRLW